MPFQPGNTYGGRRANAGRPPKTKKAAADIVREILNANAEQLSRQYIKKALDKFGDRVLCHAIDKLLPDEQIKQSASFTINFVQFNNSLQLHAPELSTPILEGDAKPQESGGALLASPSWKRQDRPEFLHIEDVPGK